jgi:bifunctional oligoribonuclease and PAP phosphatase NrnA
LDKLLFEKLKSLLSDTSLNLTIVSHVNPDGDAIGSSLALYQYFKKAKFENVRVVIPNAHPSFLTWMPHNEGIVTATREGKIARDIIAKSDFIFCLDFNDLDRTDQLASPIRNSKAQRILLDHHPDPRDEFEIVFSQTHLSSTSELIYEFICAMDGKHLLDQSIAECLYTGIVTDTGSFSYSCNHPRIYQIVAHLIELGVNGEKIHRHIYDTYSENRLRLLGHCLGEKLVVLKDYQAAYIYLSDSDLRKFKYRDGDTEGVVNYALSIEGIKLGCIFIEKEKLIKASFRSKDDVNVNILARKYFNGGGHRNAAGGNFKGTLDEALSFFNTVVKDISVDNFKRLQDVPDNM